MKVRWCREPLVAFARSGLTRFADAWHFVESLAHAPRRIRPHPFAFRWSPAVALGSSLSCDDVDGCYLCAKQWGWWRPWPTAKRHFDETGTALRGERRMRSPDLTCDPSVVYVGASAAMLRIAAQLWQGPGSSDGRFVTLRVAIGWPSESGGCNADSPRRGHAYVALRNARGRRAARVAMRAVSRRAADA